MQTLLLAIIAVILISCAPLNKQNTLGEDVGEVILRVVGCPVTLCISELLMHEERRQDALAEKRALARQKKQEQYQKWYQTLSPEEQAREDYNRMELEQRELDRLALERSAAMQALGQINQGRGIFGTSSAPPPIRYYDTPVPTYHPTPRQQTNCTSNMVGNRVYTDCY